MTSRDAFEPSYWSRNSQYRKFDDYRHALAALRKWRRGFSGLYARTCRPLDATWTPAADTAPSYTTYLTAGGMRTALTCPSG